MIIPDRFSIGLTAFGLLTCFLNPAFDGPIFERVMSSLLGGAVGFFGLWGVALLGQLMFKKEAMGGGDIKLMAAVGTICGLTGVTNCLVVSSFAGILYYGFLILMRKPMEDGTIPYGPFISVGLLFNLFFPYGINLLT
jgi:leader peptidase (prepilin peptidase)/N-methyltransferase